MSKLSIRSICYGHTEGRALTIIIKKYHHKQSQNIEMLANRSRL